MANRMRDLSDVPSFPAVYTAALRPRPGASRRRELPDLAYRVRSVRIDAERAAAFDHLMGGPATELVHPGVLHVLAFPVSLALMARGEFPFPLLGLVHLDNQLLQHRPVRVGEKVDVECRTRNLQAHRKGSTFEAVSTISVGGDIIVTDVSTYLAKGKQRGHGARREDHAPEPTPAGADRSQVQRGGRADAGARQFEPPTPTGRWQLGADVGRRYAEVSGDANPIHMSALSARMFGFPTAIAHGMYTASRAFTESRPDLSRPLRWDVAFEAPVTLPGTVLVSYRDDRAADATRCVGWKPARGEKDSRRCFTVDVTALD